MLGPAPKKASKDSVDGAEKVRGAIEAAQQHIAFIRKETSVLTASRGRASAGSSTQHMRQVALVAQEALREARRLLGELAGAGADKIDVPDRTLHGLTLRKLSESVDVTASELERCLKDLKAAEATYAAAVQEDTAASSSSTDCIDLEAGQATTQLQRAEDVAQAQVDMHTEAVEEYTRDVTQLALNVRSMQRIMGDLAQHVQQQGEVLDTIEGNMGEAADKSQQANEELQKTTESQRSGLKRAVCLLLAVVAVSGVALASVLH